jgi:DNA-binding GntR family transcriptional regulator
MEKMRSLGVGPAKKVQWTASVSRANTRSSQGERAYEHVKHELSVSRQPILDAMRRLAGERLVEIIPQVGCHLAVHTRHEIGDFFLLFASVEALLTQLAAERHDDRELRRLRLISGEIGVLRSPGVSTAERSEGHRTLNREFHGIIHEMARAPELASLSEGYWDRSDFYLTSSSSHQLFAERLTEAYNEHEALITVLAARKSQLAAATMSEHILSFRGQLLEALSKAEGNASDNPSPEVAPSSIRTKQPRGRPKRGSDGHAARAGRNNRQ